MNLLNFSLKVVEIYYQLQARLIMATVTLFLCCLLGSVSLVYGQALQLGELICSATRSSFIKYHCKAIF